MIEKTWPQGTPCWVDLSAPDLDEAITFYRGLFGWEGERGAPEFSGYTTMTSDGKAVAGLAEQMAEQRAQGVPPAWTTYFATASADDTAAAVTAGGGSVMFPPMTVAEFGRMAACSDPQGASFSLWQAGSHKGFQKWNEPSSVVWNQLSTTDPEAALAFYASVLGIGSGQFDDATVLEVDGREVAGVGGLPDGQTQPGWAVVFSVASADETAARAGELGGAVITPPHDFPYGRLAVLADPQGAVFAVGSPPAGD